MMVSEEGQYYGAAKGRENRLRRYRIPTDMDAAWMLQLVMVLNLAEG